MIFPTEIPEYPKNRPMRIATSAINARISRYVIAARRERRGERKFMLNSFSPNLPKMAEIAKESGQHRELPHPGMALT